MSIGLNPDIIKDYLEKTKLTISHVKDLPKVSKTISPTLEIGKKGVCDVLFDSNDGTFNVPVGKTLYITHVTCLTDAASPLTYSEIRINIEGRDRVLVAASSTAGTLTDAVAANTSMSFVFPIKCPSGALISCTGGYSFGGYYVDE